MSIAAKYLPNYTYEDYCQWEGQWELIEGIPYAMSPQPIPPHQNANANLYSNFKIALKKGCMHCKAYIPIDWKIDSKTVLQPDLLVVCKKIEKKFLDFTPILVAEILSPSTALKDRNVKKHIYKTQGVKYFLLLNPQTKKNEVYELVDEEYTLVASTPKSFTFMLEDGCKAKVDFSDIWE
jgi:Uma2 family endonuclease